MLARQFHFDPPRLMDIDSHDASLILSARSWCILTSARQDPMPRVRGYLRCEARALKFGLLMTAVQQAWPEPFAIYRPCCPNASVDETLLTDMIRLASAGLRPEFDALLREMFGGEARDLLYHRAALSG